MRFDSILLLAGGLAMDAAAVSAARGLATPVLRPRHALLVAGFFGGFQAAMPVLGWLIGRELGSFVQAWAHWIAFALLAGIGGKMLWEARAQPESAAASAKDLFALDVMLVLAIATSIDAFAVGVMLPLLQAPILLSAATIGVVTAALSVLGLFAGRRFGALFGRRLDALGGVVLVGLGVKIVVEHLCAR